ncbi:MAG: mucoidy inhibitor MuiA family protein [Myxococcales bacterium]|nr:mucoidy inhibitor MuiA family protein [Myxococcales bacterium]
MLYLRVEGPDGESQELSLTGPEINLGRAPGNEVHLADASVSKRHARIVVKDGRMILVDLNSTNGTYVNGRRLASPQVIHWSDVIGLGNFVLRFSDASELPPARRVSAIEPAFATPRPTPLCIGSEEPDTPEHDRETDTRAELPITFVEVFRSAALITRHGEVEIDGDATIEVRDLPLALVDASLRVSAKGAGDPRVVDVHVALQLELPDEEPIPEEAELDALRQQIARLDERRSRLTIETGHLLAVRPQLPKAPRRPDEARFSADPVPAWLSLSTCVRAEAESRQSQVQALDQQLTDLTEQLAKAEEALARISSEQRASREVRKCARVAIKGARGKIALTLDYQVPGARWFPSYELRVDQRGERAELVMSALIAQCTGEDWEGAPLALSTADITRSGRLPRLGAWRIGRARRERPAPGWRPLPPGLEELFTDFDRYQPPTPSSVPVPPLVLPGGIAGALSRAPLAGDSPALARPTVAGFIPDSPTPTSLTEHEDLRDGDTGELMLEGDLEPPPAPSHQAMRDLVTGELEAAYEPEPVAATIDEFEFLDESGASFDEEQTVSQRSDARRRERVTTAVERAAAMVVDAPPLGSAAVAANDAPAAAPQSAPAPASSSSRPIAPDARLLTYDELVVAAAHESRRGTLRPRRPDELLPGNMSQRSEAESIVQLGRFARERERQALAALTPPNGAVPVEQSSGHFAYRYEGRTCDVPSDGALHRVSVTRCELPARVSYRTVPLIDPSVFRLAMLENPLEAPLLAGPLDVFWGSDFLVTSRLDTTAPGARIEASLGVEPAVKVARNVRHAQSEKGLLGGRTVYEDHIEIEVASSLAREIVIDVIERVPVSDDRKIDIEISDESPPGRPFDQQQPIRGGRCFSFSVDAGARARCSLRYKVTLPSGSEIVGGGRRAG